MKFYISWKSSTPPATLTNRSDLIEFFVEESRVYRNRIIQWAKENANLILFSVISPDFGIAPMIVVDSTEEDLQIFSKAFPECSVEKENDNIKIGIG